MNRKIQLHYYNLNLRISNDFIRDFRFIERRINTSYLNQCDALAEFSNPRNLHLLFSNLLSCISISLINKIFNKKWFIFELF